MYDEQLSPLDDKFEGDEVALLAVRGGKVDKHFRRNYAWAKHAADTGKVKKITVVVAIDKTDWVHTFGAVTSALSGGRLHSAAEFDVRAENPGYSGTSAKVQEALKELAPPPKSLTVDWPRKAAAKAQAKQYQPKPKQDTSEKEPEKKEGDE